MERGALHTFTLRRAHAKPEHVRWALLFLLAVVAAPLFVILFLYARWWWRGGRGSEGERLPWRWLVAALAQEAAALTAAAARAARPLREGVRPLAAPRLPDMVVLAGGPLEEAALGRLFDHLATQGWTVAIFRPTSWSISVADGAAQLDAFIRADGLRPGSVLLAYGAAGLTLRHYLRRYRASGIRRAVTIATPHQGTQAPLVGFGAPQPGSTEELRQLAAGDRVPQQFEVIAISSDFDAFIAPADNAYYPGAFNIQVRGTGHFALARSARLFELLSENLGAAPTRDGGHANSPAAHHDSTKGRKQEI